MPTQIKVWEINDDQLVPRENTVFADSHREDELEDWITRRPELLGERLLIIARQHRIPAVGQLDLLAIDSNGRLVVVELKRSMAPREALAQALDYASWLDSSSEEHIAAIANTYLRSLSGDGERALADAFEETFGTTVPDWNCQNHRILLVAAGLDASAERIINYLAQRHAIDINAVFFNYCELSGQKQILVRSVLVPESATPAQAPGQSVMTESALLAMADQRKTTEVVRVCRRMKDGGLWHEEYADTAQGSFRYWAPTPEGARMVYGINVAGKLSNAPLGQLDVWIRKEKLAEVTGIAENEIEQQLEKGFLAFDGGRMNFVIRLTSVKDAETLISRLKSLAEKRMQKAVAVA